MYSWVLPIHLQMPRLYPKFDFALLLSLPFLYLNQRSGYNLILWANVRTEGRLWSPQGDGERSRPAAWPRLPKVGRRAEFGLVFWVGWHPGAVVMWGLDEWLVSSDVWRICLLWRHGRTGSSGHRVGWGLWRTMGRQFPLLVDVLFTNNIVRHYGRWSYWNRR